MTTDTPPSIYDTTAAAWPRRRSRRRQRQLQPLATAVYAQPAPGTALSAFHSLASPGHVEVRALQQLRYTQASGGTSMARQTRAGDACKAREGALGRAEPHLAAFEPRRRTTTCEPLSRLVSHVRVQAAASGVQTSTGRPARVRGRPEGVLGDGHRSSLAEGRARAWLGNRRGRARLESLLHALRWVPAGGAEKIHIFAARVKDKVSQ